MIDHAYTSTTFDLPGHEVLGTKGIVRGLVVRSNNIVGSFFAGLQTIFGGNISLYASMCEKAREDAYRLMLQHAAEMGANAVIGVHYDATEVMGGVTEVLAYGTAVIVK
jgi:uncharacterized protein YbjQ (UPF0145 family)